MRTIDLMHLAPAIIADRRQTSPPTPRTHNNRRPNSPADQENRSNRRAKGSFRRERLTTSVRNGRLLPQLRAELRSRHPTVDETDAQDSNWKEEQQRAFRQIKEQLKQAALCNDYAAEELIIVTDASDYAVAGILSCKKNHRDYPIEYMSKTLTEVEIRWPTREKEAYAIVVALQKFDVYIRGRKVTIYTDHKSLEWMFQAKKGKIARWATPLQEYDLTVIHKSGIEIAHVDALSRLAKDVATAEDRMTCMAVMTLTEEEDGLPRVTEWGQAYQEIPTVERDRLKVREWQGMLTRGGRAYVPPQYVKRVIRHFHDRRVGTHAGVVRTHRRTQELFWWPGQMEEIRQYVGACLTCQRRRNGIERTQGLSRAFPLGEIFEAVHIDFWQTRGEGRPIMTMIDRTSRWVEAAVVPDKSAHWAAATFVRRWVTRYGVPKQRHLRKHYERIQGESMRGEEESHHTTL
ncbi:putative RNase HI in long-term repeat retroelement Ty3/gypsy family protein, partial [Gregarina niphandrodes]